MAVPVQLTTNVQNETFGGVTYHIEGELVPALHLELSNTGVYFEHHTLLWKDPAVQIALHPMKGAFKRVLAGMPFLLTGASGPGFIRALRPRVFVLFAWDSAHPCMDTLNAMMGTRLYGGPRDIFSTAMKQETRIANRQVADMKCQNGHVVVRVAPGGKTRRSRVCRKCGQTLDKK